MNAMHFCIYHYISIVILSKGLNPQISTPKLSIVFACLEISPDWPHGGWCVPVPSPPSSGPATRAAEERLVPWCSHRPRLHWRPVDAGHWPLDTDPAPATFE